MATMGMNTGGAETHILELCKALRARGAEVFVASNGGAYTAELERCGVRHFKTPLHNKNIFNIIRSYFALRKIIRENEITLVHAHARIPAFLCGMLQKRLRFRFVTTAHFIFSTDGLFRVLSNWGEKTLAVSEDVKRYLVDSYRLKPENILTTVNGIDTEKFRGGVDYSGIAREFGMDPRKKRVVYVSRLDRGNCDVAHMLLAVAEEIYAHNKQLEFFVVGTGTEYELIRGKAEELNARLGERVVFMAGARTDVNQFVAACDVFIGISRAALEAMSGEKPVILAGNMGYLGIFDEAALEKSQETNFTCRGSAMPTVAGIKADILALLGADASRLAELGEYGREVVLKNYSVDAMAEATLELYDRVRKPSRRRDIIISGYYGSHNHGDDVILKAILDDMRALRPRLGITVLSQRPAETARLYGVKSVYKFNFLKINRLMKDTTLLISGGGTLIHDLTSTRSMLYYIFVINLAKRHKTRVMLYANGVGPVRQAKNRRRARLALQGVDLITLRDSASVEVLERLGVDRPPIVVTGDPAFGIRVDPSNASYFEKLRAAGMEDAGRGYFCVSVRNWKYLKPDFEKNIVDFCEYMFTRHKYLPVFIPMQPEDDDISRRLIKKCRFGAYYLGTGFTLQEILGTIAHSEFVLAMRLHSIIYGIRMGVPVIGLVYDPKVRAMMERFRQEYYCEVENIDPEALRGFADFVVLNREDVAESLLRLSGEEEERAEKNAEMAVELLERDCF